MFKDHLVTWVNEYLYEAHGETGANAIIGDIDHRYVFFFFSFSFKVLGVAHCHLKNICCAYFSRTMMLS